MKFESTKKNIVNGYHCYKVGYCALQYLLWTRQPNAYTHGVYGWNADIYDMGNDIAIVTGYRPFGKSVGYETCKKYDDMAEKIVHEQYSKMTYDEKREALDKLIKQFLNEITK